MTLSAKWTSLSILAIAALGAVACTVTSGDVDDSTGGTGSNTDVDSGDDTSNDTDASTTDSSVDPDAAATCEDNQQSNALVSLECQACLEQHCCTELKGCFNLQPGSDDAGTAYATCNDYAACLANCSEQNPSDDTAYQACVTDFCVATTSESVTTAFDGIVTCGGSSCATPCGF